MVQKLRHSARTRLGQPYLFGKTGNHVLEEDKIHWRAILSSWNGCYIGHNANTQTSHKVTGGLASYEILVVIAFRQEFLIQLVQASSITVSQNDLASYLLVVFIIEITQRPDCGLGKAGG